MVIHRICKMALGALFLSVATPTGYSYAQEPPQPDFYTLGLSATPGESAEEILLRAHNGDTQAMALVVVGYDLGANGFLRSKHLALSWASVTTDFGAANMHSFLYAYLLRDQVIDDEDKRIRAIVHCTSGQKSPVAALFKKADLFDVDGRLDEVALEKMPLSAKGKKSYRRLVKAFNNFLQTDVAMIASFRSTLVAGGADAKMEESLNYAKCGYSKSLLFYTATMHNPESESPDWNPERLFSFMEQRRKRGSFCSEAEASREINARLTYNPASDLELIRKAHAGDVIAMRTLAGAYLAKEMGVIEDTLIAYAWFELAARRGDAVSMLALANTPFDYGTPVIWAWASLAGQYGDARVQALAGQFMRQVESRASPHVMVAACRVLQEIREESALPPAPRPGLEQK